MKNDLEIVTILVIIVCGGWFIWQIANTPDDTPFQRAERYQ